MGWFRNKKSETKSISQSYKDTHGVSKKFTYWDSHKDEVHYDPTYDFRTVTKSIKKKRRRRSRAKKIKENEYEKGHDRVKRIINK